jgi:drug/metabolite transporter (DMT)-like permease
MAAAGVAWGVYTLLGRRAGSPLATTAAAFAGAVPLALAPMLAATAFGGARWDPRGAALAATSGAVTSGLGYAAWYAALPSLSRTHAAVVQLAVPVLAAAAGVAFLGEAFGGRLALAGGAVVAGIALATVGGPRRRGLAPRSSPSAEAGFPAGSPPSPRTRPER